MPGSETVFQIGTFTPVLTSHIGAGGRQEQWVKENSHYIRPELVRQFLSSGNASIDIKPIPDYQRIFAEECVREIARKLALSFNQPKLQ